LTCNVCQTIQMPYPLPCGHAVCTPCCASMVMTAARESRSVHLHRSPADDLLGTPSAKFYMPDRGVEIRCSICRKTSNISLHKSPEISLYLKQVGHCSFLLCPICLMCLLLVQSL